MGSGSTLVAAKQLGRQFIGVDLDDDYVALLVSVLQMKVTKLTLPSMAAQGATLLTMLFVQLALVRPSSGEFQALASA